jgi:AraC-like DNA-binding protein
VSLRFQVFRPCRALAPVVHCYWTLEGEGLGEPQTIFPDGRMEMVFQLGDSFSEIGTGGTATRQPARLLVGQMRRHVTVASGERVRSFGIRFHPGGAYPLFRFSQGDVEDRISALDDIHPVLSRQLARAMESGSEPLQAVERILMKFLATFEEAPAVSAALDKIVGSGGQATVRTMAADAGVSRRHLERIFRERVGMGPKTFARVVRFQRVLNSPAKNWAAVAADAGYFDQAHLARDFQQFTGETPSAWARRRIAFLQDAFLQDKLPESR